MTPDDFAQQKPAQDATACPTCNDAPGAAPFCSNGYHLAPIQPPYTTPVPTLHDGSTGWVYCEACDAPQPVAGHECVKPATLGCGDPCPTSAPCFRCRAEFAESLLCASALQHGLDLVMDDRDGPEFRGEFAWACCRNGVGATQDSPTAHCPFCDAARGGGR